MPNTQHKKKGVLVGVRDLVFAVLKDDLSTSVTYETDMHLVPGTIDLAMTMNLSDESLGADDNPVWEIIASLDSIDVALTLGSVGKEVESLLLGHAIDNNGVMIVGSNDVPPWVAMGFKSKRSDNTDDYIWLYKGKFKPSDITYHTKEKGTVNWNTPVINATFGPRDFDGNHMAKICTGDEGIATGVIESFFTTVYSPVTEPAGG